MQDDLFGDAAPPPPPTPPGKPDAPASESPVPRRRRADDVRPAAHGPELAALATALPARLRLGSSSWSYPGWAGIVWDDHPYTDATLSKHGLTAYGQHPLLRSVCIDRSFYRPLTEAQFERYAAQVPDDFRFVVKAPALVTDAQVRGEDGKGRQPNPAFLDPALAVSEFITPALAGLGDKVGALVFQLSPLPFVQLQRLPLLLERLRTMLRALPDVRSATPDGVVAVEVRDPEWLSPTVAPQLAAVLKETGATYCLGLHAKMPRLAEQLPLLRALWPGPMVCRWNLNPLHGAYGYEDAQREYGPYDRIHDVDADTRALLVRTACGITGAGQNAYITISNKAEGCAPLSARALAEGVSAHLAQRPGA
ncbi:DUF72 domain-containing protein [Hydrogenophaga electricum]|uniref:DUF72 domain-containing protein n=1 Tax=Hydrogenophaga electricum TaxID=1230953 RepID=A0ABQ6CC93_9BURK|nr:DUF72 domain-containing protein [Hydrogenophaga electricum]GLS15891.1 hypothetical protein GCM10007935_33280 [Hydrogenophaga electricum]